MFNHAKTIQSLFRTFIHLPKANISRKLERKLYINRFETDAP